jgi:hypothetical protein
MGYTELVMAFFFAVALRFSCSSPVIAISHHLNMLHYKK